MNEMSDGECVAEKMEGELMRERCDQGEDRPGKRDTESCRLHDRDGSESTAALGLSGPLSFSLSPTLPFHC